MSEFVYPLAISAPGPKRLEVYVNPFEDEQNVVFCDPDAMGTRYVKAAPESVRFLKEVR